MDPILLIGALAILLAALYYFLRKRGTLPPSNEPDLSKEQVFEFDADPPTASAPLTTRKTRIVAPAQKGQKLQVDRLALPTTIPATLEKEGQVSASVIAAVINPRLRTANGEELTNFDPPLTFTVYYADQDSTESTRKASNTPELSLVTFYEEDGIRWERLDTKIDPIAKTLTARISTLEPKDPILECRP